MEPKFKNKSESINLKNGINIINIKMERFI